MPPLRPPREYLSRIIGVTCPSSPDTTRIHELRGLERRRGSSGKDRVDHPPGGTDDVANSVAGLTYQLIGTSRGIGPKEANDAMAAMLELMPGDAA